LKRYRWEPPIVLVAPLASAASGHGAAHANVPAVAQLCGWTAGVIGVATGWPQAWRLWVGRRHEGLSLTANVLGVLYASAWLLYGIASRSTLQVVINILVLSALMTVLVGHLFLSRPSVLQWLPLLVAGWALLAAVFVVGARPLGIAASAATISGVLPQVLVLLWARRGDSSSMAGVARSRWALSFAANALWASYGLLAPDPVILVNSTIIAGLSLAIVVMARESPESYRLPVEPDYAAAA
jgi:uncharacterized protein with PQ loop repeat